jgi:CheY-like chemotaxis protein
MSSTPLARPARRVLGVDIDHPFQRVLAAWLGARSHGVMFVPLAAALGGGGPAPDLIVCELAEPKARGVQTLQRLALAHPNAPLIAISSRFVAGSNGAALARQLGVHAALAKPFSRDALYAAIEAATAAPRSSLA